MTPMNRFMPFVLTIVLAVLLQAGFIALDCRHPPYQVAAKFAQAYFRLDPAMADQLCAAAKPSQPSAMVADYIFRTREETLKRGFDLGMAKSVLYHVKTHTVQTSDTDAQVHLTALRRTAINPAFTVIAKLFNLGKEYKVDETIQMIKENGRWKVCFPVFDLAGT